MRCGYGGFCFRLVFVKMGYGGVGCKIEAMYGWGWIPRFALEDVEFMSWLEVCRCVRVLRVLQWRWGVRNVSGGCMMGLLRVEDIWCLVGGSLRGMVSLC